MSEHMFYMNVCSVSSFGWAHIPLIARGRD
jgi:hypothetical protein